MCLARRAAIMRCTIEAQAEAAASHPAATGEPRSI